MFDNAVAIVTGGESGIGAACAKHIRTFADLAEKLKLGKPGDGLQTRGDG